MIWRQHPHFFLCVLANWPRSLLSSRVTLAKLANNTRASWLLRLAVAVVIALTSMADAQMCAVPTKTLSFDCSSTCVPYESYLLNTNRSASERALVPTKFSRSSCPSKTWWPTRRPRRSLATASSPRSPRSSCPVPPMIIPVFLSTWLGLTLLIARIGPSISGRVNVLTKRSTAYCDHTQSDE